MEQNTATLRRIKFEEDVYTGLTDFPKHLSSQYFYDAAGDRLFQDIMDMPEYYLTDSEYTILDTYKEEIANLFSSGSEGFNLIELGAGDGKKTKILLNCFLRKNMQFKYVPVDISQHALDQLGSSLNMEFPELQVEPLRATYFEALEQLNAMEYSKKVVLFLGSNIGNLLHSHAIQFLRSIGQRMIVGDLLFIGCDQKKNPQIILDAYNDPAGITEAFNKNVLKRINRELQANFNPDQFLHWEVYDPETGTAKSFLVSREEQLVSIKALDLVISFKQWETIHTEISQKYDDKIVNWLAEQSGLQLVTQFSDPRNYFKNYVFKTK